MHVPLHGVWHHYSPECVELHSVLKTPLRPFRAPFKDSETPPLQCFGVDV